MSKGGILCMCVYVCVKKNAMKGSDLSLKSNLSPHAILSLAPSATWIK